MRWFNELDASSASLSYFGNAGSSRDLFISYLVTESTPIIDSSLHRPLITESSQEVIVLNTKYSVKIYTLFIYLRNKRRELSIRRVYAFCNI